MRVILFRHGIAVDRTDKGAANDAERPLTDKGRKRTRAAARGLLRLGVEPSMLLHSPLVRAVQTARVIVEVFDGEPKHKQVSRSLLPDRSPKSLLTELAHLDAEEVLCVGHSPQLERFVAHVLGSPTATIALKKAGAACVELEDLPQPHGVLRWLLESRTLRLLGR
jgi:phosphohistidine phosphatase